MSVLQCPDFNLGHVPNQEQRHFFETNGVICFRSVLLPHDIATLLENSSRLEQQWWAEGKQQVNGIPLVWGADENGNPLLQRFCFLSLFSKPHHRLVEQLRYTTIPSLLNRDDARIAEDEKDGLVMNHYLNTQQSNSKKLGWHTDVLRDYFYFHQLLPMLNIGIHLDDCPYENGGLRFLAGTHHQSLLKMLFAKRHFMDNSTDTQEQGFNIKAGDITVHHGHLWHRVQQSPFTGAASRRRVMYIPVICGPRRPKTADSSTPFYLRLRKNRLVKKLF